MNDVVELRKEIRRDRGPGRRMTWWRRVLFAIIAPIAYVLLRLVWVGYRYEILGDEKVLDLAKKNQAMVFAFWHESLLTIGWYMARIKKKYGVNITFLISPSVDGEIGVRILAFFGSRAVRGSATRSGAAALRGLNGAITNDNASPGITLDGPKGPHRYCKPGAVMAARMTGVPIVPIAVAARRSWRLKSWDRHLIPRPLSKVIVAVGDPYTVPKKGEGESLEDLRSELEARVNDLVELAEERVVSP